MILAVVAAAAATTAPAPTDAPEVDLVTFGEGDVIFEKYGHAALCLRYHDERPEICFNYGVTDFDSGAVLAWRFTRGEQRFWAEPEPLAPMLSFYEGEDRDVWLQTLPIHGDAARAVEAKLWHDTEAAYRYYVYDHFTDNCTTRLRDIIDSATGGALRANTDAPYPLTYREMGRRGLAELPELLIATDLFAGRTTDAHPTLWQAMFLPEFLRDQVAARLGVPPVQLYHRRGPPYAADGPSGRVWLVAIGLIFALPICWLSWRRRAGSPPRWQLSFALGWLSLELLVLGMLIWGLVILSPVPTLHLNEAALVVTPLDALLLFRWTRRRYAQLRTVELLAVSLLAAIGVLNQPLWLLIAIVVLPMAAIATAVPRASTAADTPLPERLSGKRTA